MLLFLSAAVLAGAMTIAALGHAMLAASQIEGDGLHSQLAGAIATQQNLQVERAQLETPSRVLWLGEHRFKMSAPTGVTYLVPVNVGESVEQAHESHRAPATANSAVHRRRAR